VLACSPLYRNPAVGPGEQPDFVNAVAELRTGLAPPALLDALQDLEARQGRVRGPVRWAPRRIDLDLLVYGNMRIADPRLTVPHPRIGERAFVLKPLADLAPALEIPGLGRVRDLLAAVPTGDLEKLEEGWRAEPARAAR
jgi:2-amino-4-hydroxy-6-hydroxymethyldihydropteridine diphosphokinase